MGSEKISIEQRIKRDRLDHLFKRSHTANLTLLVICLIYIFLLMGEFSWQSLVSWYFVLLAVLSGRWISAMLYARAENKAASLSFWLYVFRFGILAAGLTIGSLNFLFFSREPLTYLLLAIIFPYGIVAGAVTILLDFTSFCIYVITLMMPIIYQTALGSDRLHIGTGILTFVLSIFFLKFSRQYNNNFVYTQRLSYKNKTLVEDLKQEKNKLNNRLGRIFNDSSNEIFVVDADTLDCVQVNQGAVEDLGYSIDEFVSLSLLDIFVDLDRGLLNELLVPLHRGHQETVIYKGISQRKDGTTFPVEARLQLSIQDVPPIIVIIAQDITERSEWEKKLIYQANYDQLTGLFNRFYMNSFMDSAFKRARRYQQKVALLFIDLDNFKNINDTLGHYTGDKVLQQASKRIRALLRGSDTPARTGGDEFTVLLECLEENANAEIVARKIVDIFKQPFLINERQIHTTVSIGISIYPDDGDSIDQLMKHADMAMYHVKEDGRNNYCFFSQEMRRFSEEAILISNHLRHALEKKEFSLFFQPKIDTVKGRIIGAEALLRWHNHELGDISPVTFIPLAEQMGLVNDIGTWVLKEACREAVGWREFSSEKLKVAVNISPKQFHTDTLLEVIDTALLKSGLSRDLLELEITENLLLQGSGKPLAVLETLHDHGISLALDDFGTGYSSLSYLKRFPVQVLKIDRSFICDLEDNKNSRALVEAIIAMAHSLKLEVVAEGVENKKQLNFLCRRDVTIIQGFYFSPAVSAEKFRSLLQNESNAGRLSKQQVR